MEDLTILHRLVWFNDAQSLDAYLTENDCSQLINHKFRGLAPIHLAIQLGHAECVDVLIKRGADMLCGTDSGFLPLQEATSLGDREMMKALLIRRQDQVRDYVYKRQPELHRVVREDIDDLYLEMNWDFKSWVPFFSMLCPNDCYKIWKRGNRLRIDSTLLGLGKLKWLRGNLSYLFIIDEDASHFYVLDHDKKIWQKIQQFRPLEDKEIEEDLNTRLNQEIVVGRIDSRRPVRFSRSRSIMGLGDEIVERVGGESNGYLARVYAIENMEWLTRTRKEHLRDRPEGDLSKQTSSWFLGYGGRTAISKIKTKKAAESDATSDSTENSESTITKSDSSDSVSSAETLYKESLKEIQEALTHVDVGQSAQAEEITQHIADFDPHQIDSLLDENKKLAYHFTPSLAPPSNRAQVPFEEYFPAKNASIEEQSQLPYIHMGRPLKQTEQRKQLTASLWMSKEFPLSIDQLLPLFEIMSPSNEYFDKLRDFISMQLPPGFPVQVEIPLLLLLSARITFKGFKWWTKETRGEIPIPKASDPMLSSKLWFEIPADYKEGVVIDSIFKTE